jgi:hypothetical protein
MVLDIIDAFHQLSVKEERTKYLCIITPFSQYTYQVAPMGFCNSPNYIETALQVVISPNVAVYMDDIVIHARGSIEDHEDLADKVLKIVEDHKPKCTGPRYQRLGRRHHCPDHGQIQDGHQEPVGPMKQLQGILGTVS